MAYRIRKQTASKQIARLKRHRRVRGRLCGTPERPRLVVFRSCKHIYAQVIDDLANRVLVQSSSLKNKEKKSGKGKVQSKKLDHIGVATQIGMDIAKKGILKKITSVVFDCAGYKYHGRVKALAEGARKGGLVF